MSNAAPTSADFMTKEQKAFLLQAIWSSLQVPSWTKDDLIEFGKAIFVKKSLAKLDEKIFLKIFPFLTEITNALGIQLMEHSLENQAKEEAEKTAAATAAAPAPAPEAEKNPPAESEIQK